MGKPINNFEKSIIGPYTFLVDQADPNTLSSEVWENRSLFIDYCQKNAQIALNTQYKKRNEHLLTYVNPGYKK